MFKLLHSRVKTIRCNGKNIQARGTIRRKSKRTEEFRPCRHGVVGSGYARLHGLGEVETGPQNVKKLRLAVLEAVRRLRKVVHALPFVRAGDVEKRIVHEKREIRCGHLLEHSETHISQGHLRRRKILACGTEIGIVPAEIQKQHLKTDTSLETSGVVSGIMRSVVVGGLSIAGRHRQVRHERTSALDGFQRHQLRLDRKFGGHNLRTVRERKIHIVGKLEASELHLLRRLGKLWIHRLHHLHLGGICIAYGFTRRQKHHRQNGDTADNCSDRFHCRTLYQKQNLQITCNLNAYAKVVAKKRRMNSFSTNAGTDPFNHTHLYTFTFHIHILFSLLGSDFLRGLSAGTLLA